MKRLITDEYPRKAVYYWLLCNGGSNKVSVFVKNNTTIFVNKYGDVLIFNHVIDFSSDEPYRKLGKEYSIKELCGDEE